MEFTITGGQILAFCGLVTALYGVYKVFREMATPHIRLKEEVEKHTEYLANDMTRLNEMEESNRMILKSLLVIINHDITGNGVDKLKEARNELQEFLIDK